MGNVIVSMFLTLDCVIEEPQKWSFPFWNDEMAKFKLDELFASDVLLLGRVTYQVFAEAWLGRTDEEGYADRINGLSKYVVSTTLKEPLEWNNSTLIKGNVAEEVSKAEAAARSGHRSSGAGRSCTP